MHINALDSLGLLLFAVKPCFLTTALEKIDLDIQP